jgi:hypothetical protein
VTERASIAPKLAKTARIVAKIRLIRDYFTLRAVPADIDVVS